MFSIKLFLRGFKTELVPPLLDVVNNSHRRGESFSQTQLLSSQPNEMKASYNLLVRQPSQENSSLALSRIPLPGVLASGYCYPLLRSWTNQNIFNEKPFSVITENAQINKTDDLFMPVGAERAFSSVELYFMSESLHRFGLNDGELLTTESSWLL